MAGICRADWREEMESHPVSLREGITVKAFTMEKPRRMRAYLAKIDLTTPGIGFTATERAAEWGKPMPDYTNKVVQIDTKRETTAAFMMRNRQAGKNVEIAVNTAPWIPWVSPYTHKYAAFCNWNVSEGVEVSHVKTPRKGAFFVVRKDGGVEITPEIPVTATNNISIAMCGFWMIMTNGVPAYTSRSDAEPLPPRMALGLTPDKKTLVMLAIDGRQPGYSLGADNRDLFDILKREGVSDAVNMDGGGSTSLVVYDRTNARPLMLNHQPGRKERKVALNLGITFAPESEIRANDRTASNLHSYEFIPIKDTPPPDGFKPFYVSHYGRHGSRRTGNSPIEARNVLKEAQRTGTLTDKGRELLADIEKVAEAHDHMMGDLTWRGAEEHRTLARRMFRRFPAVFAGRRRIRSRSTVYPRVLLSQTNFTLTLKDLAPKLEFDFITGERYQRILNPPYFAKDRNYVVAKAKELVDALANETIPMERFIKRFFTDPSVVEKPVKFARRVFDSASNCQCLRYELGGLNMYHFFEADELAALSRCLEAEMYARMGNSEELGNHLLTATKPLLADFLKRAEEAISDDRIAADFRFGHDNGLWPLAGLLRLEGPGDCVPLAESYKLCPTWKWMCMAANLQMVFYRNDNGDVLVKILWNEREMTVRALAPYKAPYYKWNDLKPILASEAKASGNGNR